MIPHYKFERIFVFVRSFMKNIIHICTKHSILSMLSSKRSNIHFAVQCRRISEIKLYFFVQKHVFCFLSNSTFFGGMFKFFLSTKITVIFSRHLKKLIHLKLFSAIFSLNLPNKFSVSNKSWCDIQCESNGHINFSVNFCQDNLKMINLFMKYGATFGLIL